MQIRLGLGRTTGDLERLPEVVLPEVLEARDQLRLFAHLIGVEALPGHLEQWIDGTVDRRFHPLGALPRLPARSRHRRPPVTYSLACGRLTFRRTGTSMGDPQAGGDQPDGSSPALLDG